MITDEFFWGTKNYHKNLIDICKPLIDYLGITHIIYVNLDKNGNLFTTCSHPKWVELFIQEKYYQLDPLMVHPKNIHNGFSFDSSINDNDFQNTLLYDAVIKFNWCNSFAYIEKTPDGGYFGFDFGTVQENLIANRLVNESRIIKKAIRDAHKRINFSIKDINDNRMDFAKLKGEIFYTQNGIVFNENKNKIKLINDLGIIDNAGDLSFLAKVSLSAQEINCLRIYITNHSIKVVARELNLAISTVSDYIESVKTKLRCNNKRELLKKCEILEAFSYI